jgi:hypothetical protein
MAAMIAIFFVTSRITAISCYIIPVIAFISGSNIISTNIVADKVCFIYISLVTSTAVVGRNLYIIFRGIAGEAGNHIVVVSSYQAARVSETVSRSHEKTWLAYANCCSFNNCTIYSSCISCTKLVGGGVTTRAKSCVLACLAAN